MALQHRPATSLHDVVFWGSRASRISPATKGLARTDHCLCQPIAPSDAGFEDTLQTQLAQRIQGSLVDPIYGHITFDLTNPHEKLLWNLVQTKEMQRLRDIRQLGLGTNTYLSANHTRFEHSMGAFILARKIIAHFKSKNISLDNDPTRESKRILAFLAGAMLHDIGHGPFSHTFERATGSDHEEWTQRIILEPGTEIHRVLRNYDPSLPTMIAALLKNEPDQAFKGKPHETHTEDPFSELIHGQFNVDSLDYTLRDAYFTKFTTDDLKKVDLPFVEGLIQHMDVHPRNKKIYFHKAALSPLQTWLKARLEIYKHIVFRKATIAPEMMLKLTFDRYKEIMTATAPQKRWRAFGKRGKESPIKTLQKALADVPLNLQKAFSGETLTTDEYLRMDDGTVKEFLKTCRTSPDETLKRLGRGILERKYYRGIDLSRLNHDEPLSDDQIKQLLYHLEPLVTQRKVVLDINRKVRPFKLPHVLVEENSHGKLQPLAKPSSWVQEQKYASKTHLFFYNPSSDTASQEDQAEAKSIQAHVVNALRKALTGKSTTS